jgi:hypothetical protein
MMKLGSYRYRIKSLGESSRRYGPCEVCHKDTVDVHYQVEQQRCTIDGDTFWTCHACHDLFGHEACLMGSRR